MKLVKNLQLVLEMKEFFYITIFTRVLPNIHTCGVKASPLFIFIAYYYFFSLLHLDDLKNVVYIVIKINTTYRTRWPNFCDTWQQNNCSLFTNR